MNFRIANLGLIAALAFASSAFAQSTNAPNYLNPLGRLTPTTGVTCINPTTKDPESCAGGSGSSALIAGEAHIGEVGGKTAVVGNTFTSTATTTALTDGQSYSNSGTAGSVVPLDFATACRVNAGSGMVRRVRMKSADTGLAGKSLWLYLYRDSPTSATGDHGTFSTTESNFIGRVSVTFTHHFSDPYEKGIGTPEIGSEINFGCAALSQHLYGLTAANGATATLQGSKVLTVVLEILDN